MSHSLGFAGEKNTLSLFLRTRELPWGKVRMNTWNTRRSYNYNHMDKSKRSLVSESWGKCCGDTASFIPEIPNALLPMWALKFAVRLLEKQNGGMQWIRHVQQLLSKYVEFSFPNWKIIRKDKVGEEEAQNIKYRAIKKLQENDGQLTWERQWTPSPPPNLLSTCI